MAPMETSRRLVPKVTAGSRPEPVRGVGFSAKGVLRNHDAGSARRPVPKEAVMHFYTGQHRFYCGVDLHTRTLSLCVLDHAGGVLLEATLPPEPDQFLEALAPYRDGLVVGCECLFAWYWLADLCAAEAIPFVLGHALYLKAIHGGKTKTDTIDARKLARLLRGGNFTQAYVYPKPMRARSEERRVGKSVDIGGGSTVKKNSYA